MLMNMSAGNILFSITVCLLLVIRPSYSLSACDDVDVSFLIDIDSIIHNGDDIENLIKSVIWDGSSEYSAFSVVLYGENVPTSIDNVKVIELDDNVNINQRAAEEGRIIRELDGVFNEISQNENNPTKTIALQDAFNMADEQHKPIRAHKKREILSDYNVAIFDDENAYIIFDYENKLISSDNNEDLCFLLTHNEENRHETIHFLLGQSYDIIDINCNEQHRIYANTFFYVNELFSDEQKKEQFLDVTCPAYVIAPQYGGFVNLGNHVQWIDVATIIECNLEEIDAGNVEAPVQLNSETSYIKVKDYTTDDNTFKINDYLLSFPEIHQRLNALGCKPPVYKIKDIEVVDSNTYDNYNIIKVYVTLPKSPVEYINDADVGAHKNNKPNAPQGRQRNRAGKNKGGQRSKRIRRLFWEEIGNAFEDAWDDVSDFVVDALEIDTGDQSYPLLPSITFGDEWTYTKTAEYTKSFGTKPKFTFTGTAEMTLTAGYSFSTGITLYFYFYWHIFYDEVYLWVSIEPLYSFDLWFTAEFTGQITVDIEKIMDWSQYYFFSIGPVPVMIKPFITLNAKLETIPIRIKAGINCHYGEEVEVGYEYQNYEDAYSNYQKLSRKVFERYTDSNNGCYKVFELGSEEENQEACPAMQLGFDITSTLKIGANLYSMITAYGKLVLELPFRITVPQMDNAICSGASTSCNDGNYLQVSFTYGPMDLTIYAGIEFEFSLLEDILNIILGLTDTGSDVSLSQNVAEYRINTWTILEQQTLGCTTLSGGLSFLNTYYKSRCCSSNGGSLSCDSHVIGYLSAGESKSYSFTNTVTQRVIFTNCDTVSDTKMFVYDSNGNDITSSSDNQCDGDDCSDSSVSCAYSFKETIVFGNLVSGTYSIKIQFYSGSTSGNYEIDTQCGECYSQGPCNTGYMDRTNGNYYWWACGAGCVGGKYWTNHWCDCACVPQGICAASANYNDFNLYRFTSQLAFIRTFGVTGEYLVIMMLVLAITIATVCCYKSRKCMFNRRNKYKVVSMVDSSDCENV